MAEPRTATSVGATVTPDKPDSNQQEVIADRFVVERVAGRGGMGVVFRALDRVTGEPVAVKVVGSDEGDPARFAREAQVLAELNHPAIVGYVAHGTTGQGRPFLAMEWLEGEDLSARLERAGLSLAESVTLVRRVATGLAEAHGRGIVHRDIKPSNIFLVGGDVGRAKLLDFGIARVNFSGLTAPLTRSGAVLGTIGYMAPEQALADEGIDARADVFSLGAVLFECVTGAPAFMAKHVVGVLAKVLREDAPRVRQIRADLPEGLDEVVSRMLARNASLRPRDGAEVLLALACLDTLTGDAPKPVRPKAVRLSDEERRFICAILATGIPEEVPKVVYQARAFGGELLRLANGMLLVLFENPSSPKAQVLRAAGCARTLREAFPAARIALVTSRTVSGLEESPASVADRALGLLDDTTGDQIRICASTAVLLGNDFDVVAHEGVFALRDTGADAPVSRRLLGVATPFIGRDKEIGLLDGAWRECVEDAVPRAMLVVGPAGQGKSRLWQEFASQVRQRTGARVLLARSDAVGAGSSFLAVRQLLRHALGAKDGRPPEEAALRSRVRALVPDPAVAARIGDFLLELLGLPSSEAPTPQLRAARNDPQIMATWLRQSFGEWLAAESAKEPLIVVLEDLHWADLPSVIYVGDALRDANTRSLMVLALARPEVKEVFPKLWSGVEVLEIALGRLSPAASERFVRAMTGDRLPTDAVSRIVRRAEGNAFYLEELIRYVASGNVEGLPDTVLAVVQSRLHQLAPTERRLVRAASVFGEVFWRRGVERLLGAAEGDPAIEESIRSLIEREVFEARKEVRFGESEYAFRHALLREGALEMLTDDDRVTGHHLAGAWLEEVGAQDPLMLADHFELGQQPARALPYVLRAQQAAYDGGNVPAVLALAARGARCGAAGNDLGTLRLIEALALTLQSSWSAIAQPCAESMALLPRGSAGWFLSASMAFLSSMFLGDPGGSAALLFELLNADVKPEPTGPYALAVFSTCLGLIGLGQIDMARAFTMRAWNPEMASQATDPAYVLRLQTTIGFLRIAEDDLAAALETLSSATSLADRTGDAWGRACSSTQYVAALGETGLVARVESTATHTIAYCEGTGLSLFSDWTKLHLARARRTAGRLESSLELARTLLTPPDPLLVATARALIADLLVASGEVADGVSTAKRALADGSAFPPVQAAAFATLGRAELTEGRAENALAHACKGLEAAALSAWPRERSALRLLRAEALLALGRRDEAREVLREARAWLTRTATAFTDPAARLAFEATVTENARILALAGECLEDLPGSTAPHGPPG